MDKLKRFFTPTAFKVGVLSTFLSLLIYGMGIPFFHLMELKAYDLGFLYRGPVGTSGEVAIVAIDQKSIDALGRWPWPRTRIADLIEKLNVAGAKVIAFDIVFSEPDISGKGNNDARLASALKKSQLVVLGYFFFTSDEEIKHLDKKELDGHLPFAKKEESGFLVRSIEKDAPPPDVLTAAGIEENIPIISKAASDLGYFNIVPDPDGTVRWAPAVIKYRDDYYPHLSIEAVRRYLDLPPLMLNTATYGVDSLQIGDVIIPADERGRLLINYRGPQKSFPHYSFSDVLSGAVPADAFKDKIILVGATAIGIYDMRVTPFSGTFPGVEIHANIIDNILLGDFINRPDWIVVFDILAVLLLGISISVTMPRVHALYAMMLTVALAGLYLILNNYIFDNWKIWLTAVYPIMTIVFVSASVTTYQFWTEEKKRRQVKDAFSRYVAPALINEILKDPDKLVLGGEERRLTVLFSDIRGFTTISEKLKPQELVKLMNDYLTPMTDIVLKNGGTIDKYMGDAIMAFWGAPIWQEDHPVRACRAALEMMKRLGELQIEWEKAGLPRIDIGVGISTGRLTVGNMGSTTRFDYTVMGDTVNLGSRLEGLNKEYGTHIIVPKYTYEEIKNEFILRQLDMIRVKGKDIPISIYELMGNRSGNYELKELALMFEEGLAFYQLRDWDKAERSFNDLLKLIPDDGPSSVFLTRIKHLRDAKLPRDWDGVFVMTKK